MHLFIKMHKNHASVPGSGGKRGNSCFYATQDWMKSKHPRKNIELSEKETCARGSWIMQPSNQEGAGRDNACHWAGRNPRQAMASPWVSGVSVVLKCAKSAFSFSLSPSHSVFLSPSRNGNRNCREVPRVLKFRSCLHSRSDKLRLLVRSRPAARHEQPLTPPSTWPIISTWSLFVDAFVLHTCLRTHARVM